MKHLNEILTEAYDIRNRMISEGSSVKYYTVKQSIKLLKDQLKEIESEDDKATAVYHALGDPDNIGAMDIVYGKPDMGCETDMSKVFNKVCEFVDNNCTLGFEAFEGNNSSQHLLEKKDMLIASEVETIVTVVVIVLVEAQLIPSKAA